MAKRSGKCPKCSEHLEFDSDSGEPVVCPGCGTRLTAGKAPDQPDPLIGTTLGEFKIGELLGRGAMGAVYKASQPSLDRMVAIKVLPRAHSEKFATRFEREARAAAAVNHPNIINIYSVGSDQGYQYIAMEFVDGETLGDILKREGPLPPERVIEMMKQTASAMIAAHGAGILHRDIKPDNILLTPRGDVKVADFGLAKRPEVDVSVTQAGRPLGTPLYMPPEVARGGQFQAASDLYSLGATFYHLLAGRPPFEGGSQAEIAIKQVESDPPPLTETAPNIPSALAWAIDRLLARKPADRFPTAKALLENLEYIDAGMAASQSDSASDTLMPAAKRRALDKMPVAGKAEPKKLLIAGIAAGVLIVAVVLVLIFALGPKDETPHEEKVPPVVKPDPVVKPKPGPVVVKPKPPITPKPKPKPPKPKPVSEWTTLANGWRVGKAVNLGPVVNSSTSDNDPSVSADGRTMVFTSSRGGGQGQLDLWMSSRSNPDAPWGQPANPGAPLNTKGHESGPSLSADGLTLVFQSNRGGGQGGFDLWMSTRRGRAQAWGPPVNLPPPVNSPTTEGGPCLSTDGLTLIFVRGDGRRYDTHDLWMSSRPSADAPWGEPASLGAPVNTKYTEGSPSLSADGLTLVFQSNRAGGQGNNDLWMSTRAGATKPFGEPVNLGPSVNSGTHDNGACLIADRRTLYFYATRPGGHGKNDIWQAPLLPPGAPPPTAPQADGPEKRPIYAGPWIKQAKPVLSPGPSGAWDSLSVMSPCVIKVGDSYRMYYLGTANKKGPFQTGLATSKDLIRWTKYPQNPILRVEKGKWDFQWAAHATVIRDGALFRMYYGGRPEGRTGYAASTDGIRWTKPVLGLFEYKGSKENNICFIPAKSGAWDSTIATAPQVLKVAGTYHAYYHAAIYGRGYRAGHATSRDGIRWTRDPVNPVILPGRKGEWDDSGLKGVHVVHSRGSFHMFYHGRRALRDSRFGLAVSSDGSRWRKWRGNPILSPGPPGAWDSAELGHPWLFEDDAGSFLFYMGQKGNYDHQIGFAKLRHPRAAARPPTAATSAYATRPR